MPDNLVDWLGVADALGLALVAVRLVADKLVRAYPALTAHALIETLISILSLSVSTATINYAWAFVWLSPVRWALWITIVWGLAKSALGPYPSLVTVARYMVGLGGSIALITVLYTLRWDFLHVGPQVKALPAILLIDRTVTMLLAVLILTLCAVLNWFLIPLRRNCVYLCLGFGLIFSTRSGAVLLRNALGPEVTPSLNLGLVAISAMVFLGLALALNRAGEQTKAFVGRRPPPAQLERSVRRLADLAANLDNGTDRTTKTE
jgi:hypothetical protein